MGQNPGMARENEIDADDGSAAEPTVAVRTAVAVVVAVAVAAAVLCVATFLSRTDAGGVLMLFVVSVFILSRLIRLALHAIFRCR